MDLSVLARATICASLSTEHGPAITAIALPPTTNPRVFTTVRSDVNSDDARL